MTVYRPDDPERLRAAADRCEGVASAADTSVDCVTTSDPGDRMQGQFADAVRARLRERRAEVVAITPGLRALADRLRDQGGVVAARIAAIEAAAAEAASLCRRWPELGAWTRGLAGLDTGWLEVVGPLRAEAALLRAREVAAATLGTVP